MAFATRTSLAFFGYTTSNGIGSRKPPSRRSPKSQFYSPEVEVELNELVERPANRAFDKLRAGLPIVAEDRERIAVYIATMLKRVPGHRQKTLRMAPQILEDTVSKLRNQIETAGQMRDIDPSIVARRLAELDATADQFQKRLPDDIIDQIRTPWPTEVMVELVLGMTWRFVSTEGPSYFLTSDNPAFFFEAYGLGNPESELTFTLTSNLALLGSRQTGGEGRVLKAKPLLVKEINRRVASTATRFLFYREQKDWVATLGRKTDPYLSRIQW